jgi:hypothetical protein
LNLCLQNPTWLPSLPPCEVGLEQRAKDINKKLQCKPFDNLSTTRSEQQQAHANKTTGEGKGHREREQKEGRKESSAWRPRFVPLRL